MNDDDVTQGLQRLRSEIANAVTGYEDVVTDLLTGLLAEGHVLLEGVPGVAKTRTAKTFAATTGLAFKRVQFTQDLLPADVTGHYFFNQKKRDFEIREGPVFTHVLLADEINRAPPKAQSALLEAMEERQVTIEGTTLPLHHPFMVIATMNPVDNAGVYRLPEAQLDRFMIRTRMTYLADEVELDMLVGKLAADTATAATLDRETVTAAQARARRVRVARDVARYLQRVGRATRDDKRVVLGASPRAMEHALHAARALAVLDGRDYATPDDVKAVVPKVFNHRILLDADADIAGDTVEGVIDHVLQSVEVPKGLVEAGEAV